MPRTVPDGDESRPASAVLRGAGTPTLVAGAVVVAVSVPFGGRAVAGSAVGALLTLAVFSLGPLLLRTSSRMSPPAVMAVAVAGYAGSVLFLGLAFALLAHRPWLSSTAVGVAIILCALVWTTGHLRAAARLRVLAYGSPEDPPEGHDVAGHGGSAESPGRSSH